MKTILTDLRAALAAGLVFGCSATGTAGTLEAVSAVKPAGISGSGSGPSAQAILTPDGRYALFGSAANNVALAGATAPLPQPHPEPVNVFLRDRQSGSNTFVSLNFTGASGGNGASVPRGVSTDGQFALFESIASNLLTGDTNGAADIFLRDLATSNTVLVSVNTNGGWADGDSQDAVMTPDGRFVAFSSRARNLVAGDANGIPDVFVRDLQTGTTVLASPGAVSTMTAVPNAGGPASLAPRITPDGRYVAFFSTAVGLAPGVGSPGEIYVRDLVGEATIHASAGAHSVIGAPLVAYNHRISDDGRSVAYQAHAIGLPSYATIFRYDRQLGNTEVISSTARYSLFGYKDARTLDMTPDGRFIAFVGSTNNGSETMSCVFRWDAQTGVTTLVSADVNNSMPTNGIAESPAMDASGRFVSFLSTAANLVSNVVDSEMRLYLRDMETESTTLVDVDSIGAPATEGALNNYGLTPDGRFIVFDSLGDLVATDGNRTSDVFVRDLEQESTELVSMRHSDLPSFTPNGFSGMIQNFGVELGTSMAPHFSVSADGRFVSFASAASNLTPDDTNAHLDVFVRDLLNGTNILVSTGEFGDSAEEQSSEPVISANGRYVAFSSWADNVVAGDTNGMRDVFVRDLETGTTVLVSVSTNGVNSGQGESLSPQISADGNYVLFYSNARDLSPDTPFGYFNLFWRNIQMGVTKVLPVSFPGSDDPYDGGMSSDGRYVAIKLNFFDRFYVRDMQLNQDVYTNSTSPSWSGLWLSSDGRRIIYNSSGLRVQDIVAGTNGLLSEIEAVSVRFSPNGRFAAYSRRLAAPPYWFNVFFADLETGEMSRVTRAFNGADPNHHSDSLAISPDGRFIAFRSRASNLVPNDTNGVADVFHYDRQTSTTTLITVSAFTGEPANNLSLSPVFSAGGQTLFFKSWASDLVCNDFNQVGDIFSIKFASSSGETLVFGGQIVFAPGSGQSPTLKWPVVSGRTYMVEFKNDLTDPVWQPVNGTVSIVGDSGCATDLAPSSTQRFYRIRAQ